MRPNTLPLTLAGLCLAALLTSPAAAWGPIGHRTVAEIASHHLTPRATTAVASLLGTQTMAEAAYWADEIRALPEWKKADSWHWVTIEDGETYAASAKNPAGDLIEALGRFEATLRNPAAPRDERVVALRFLIHLVGDIHQPLHVGRRADAGGNKIAVTLNSHPETLHWVWDAVIINDMGYSYRELAHALDHATPEQVKAWQASTVLDWATEAQALRPQVYDIGDGNLNYLYSFKQGPVIQSRLEQAGVRLAGLLNAIFDSPPAPH